MSGTSQVDRTGVLLPEPDVDAVASSTQLIGRIVERIEQRNGVLRFDEYMQMALYEPGLGYYSSAVEIGAAGDFVTAPQISPLFGDCIAHQIRSVVEQGCVPQILEFGAGNGHLCMQIMQAMPELERYLILDLSAGLRQRQQAYLKAHLDAEQYQKIMWLERLPTGFSGVVLANEVLDAMPVRLVEKQAPWCEFGVGFDGRGFEWQRISVDATLQAALVQLESKVGEFALGYRSEVNLNFGPWMQALAEACDQVIMLIIDYGFEQTDYYHPQRNQGTLICHYRHRVHQDPLIFPGLQDITAFVDFDAAADAGEAAGFTVSGLITQAEFLLANGLLEVAEQRSKAADTVMQFNLSQQIKTLTLPQEMGEKFKVLALQKALALDLPAMRRGGVYG